MVQTTSLFSQLLKHFPRAQFQSLVKEHGAERAAKGFTCWTQFVWSNCSASTRRFSRKT